MIVMLVLLLPFAYLTFFVQEVDMESFICGGIIFSSVLFLFLTVMHGLTNGRR